MEEAKSIIKDLAEGKIEQFEYLFNKFYSPLCALSRKYLNDQSEAEDVVCSLFVNLWRNRSKLSEIRSVNAYLAEAVHNLSLNKIRENSSRRIRDEKFYKTREYCHDTDDQIYVETKLDSEVISKIVYQVKQSLPKQCREITEMRREEKLSYKEIAEKLNISIGSVKTQLFRANKRIREALKNYTFSFFL